MTAWLIVGAGYTGERVGEMLRARGDDVTVTRRDATAANEVAARLDVRGVAMEMADAHVDEEAIVVVTAPPSGTEARFAAAMARDGARRIVYVSSTGVYAPAG